MEYNQTLQVSNNDNVFKWYHFHGPDKIPSITTNNIDIWQTEPLYNITETNYNGNDDL